MGKVIVRLTLEELKKKLWKEAEKIVIEGVYFRPSYQAVEIVISGPNLPDQKGELETRRIEDLVETPQLKILTKRQSYFDDYGICYPNPFFRASSSKVLQTFQYAKTIYRYIFKEFTNEWSNFGKEFASEKFIPKEWEELKI